MRWRTLLLIGVGVTLIGLAVAIVTLQFVPDDDEQTMPAEIIVAGGAVLVVMAIVGLVAGWFGRDRDEVTLVAIGLGISAASLLAAGSFVVADWQIGAALIGIALAVVAATIGRVTWWIGDAICELRELPTQSRLLPPAYPEEYPGVPAWTTEAGPALRTTLGALADRVAPDAPVDARAVGIQVGFPRERPVVVLLACGRLAVEPVDFAGASIGEPTVLTVDQLAEVSFPSEAADGTDRKQINAFDDIIDVRTRDGSRLRLRLAYGTRGAGTTTGGPDVIRTWLRTNAAAYR